MARGGVKVIVFVVSVLCLLSCRGKSGEPDFLWLAFLQISGVPQDLRIEHAYQVNLDLLDRVGAFFFRSQNARSIDQIRAAALFRLAGESDHRFLMIGRNGVAVYSAGPGRLQSVAIPAAARARGVAVGADGRMAIVLSDGSLDICHQLTSAGVSRVPGCAVLSGTYRQVSAAGSGFVAVSADGIDQHSATGNPARLVGGKYEAASLVGSMLYTIGEGGSTVSAYESGARGYTLAHHLEGVRIPVGEGVSGMVPVMDIAALNSDRIAVLSQTHNCAIILDGDLQPISFLRFPPMPRPLRRIDFVRGLAGVPGEVTFGVFNYDAFSVFSAEPITGDPSRHIPTELREVTETIATLDPGDFEPGSDLLSIPAVAEALRDARAQLSAELRR